MEVGKYVPKWIGEKYIQTRLERAQRLAIKKFPSF